MRKEKGIRLYIRFSDELGTYINETASRRCVGSHEFVRSVLGEYKEREEKKLEDFTLLQQEVIV